MIEILQDYYTVAIERRYEDTKTKSGIILLNAAYVDDQDMDRYEHKRIYGTVVSVPQAFSDTPYRAIDDGMPSYRKFIGHDDIVDRINRGYNNHAHKTYYPSTFDKYDVVTMADVAENVRAQSGDKIYFTPQTTEDENYLGKHEGMELYKVTVTDIYCIVKDDQIMMQGEWALVLPNMETWEEITTKSGIIMKPRPENKWLEGMVVSAHHSYNWLNRGDKIIYLPNADCEVKIEGEKYFVMPVQDIIGKLTAEVI